jgi:hypothetical protein
MLFEVCLIALPPCMEMCALSEVYTTHAADGIIMEVVTLLHAVFYPILYLLFMLGTKFLY